MFLFKKVMQAGKLGFPEGELGEGRQPRVATSKRGQDLLLSFSQNASEEVQEAHTIRPAGHHLA